MNLILLQLIPSNFAKMYKFQDMWGGISTYIIINMFFRI